MTSRSTTQAPAGPAPRIAPITRFAVAVDGEAGGRDAFALARSLARSPRADLLAITIIPDLSLIAPWAAADPMRHDIELQMRKMRDEWHPRSRIAVDRDRSVARGLCRMVTRNHRELLVIGSSHHAAEGEVRLSGHGRQLIGHLPCPLMLAPRGLASRRSQIRRVAVGLDDSAASSVALVEAARLAATAELVVCSVVDDSPPAVGWSAASVSQLQELWNESLADEVTGTETSVRERTAALGRPVTVEIRQGAPGDVLTALTEEVDLLVLGSRRWGPVARLVLGGTGERLVHGSRCPLVIVPRPADAERGGTGEG